MARRIHLQPHLSVEELERRYQADKKLNDGRGGRSSGCSPEGARPRSCPW